MGEIRNEYKIFISMSKKRRYLLKYLRVRTRITTAVIWILNKKGGRVWIEFMWLRTWSNDEFRTRQWIFRFHTGRGAS
jgi:hypothetical protein